MFRRKNQEILSRPAWGGFSLSRNLQKDDDR